MAGVKETPRQKMIGMMYLVLTALLALQVSSALIYKFQYLNTKLEDAQKSSEIYNNQRLVDIKRAVKLRGEKTEEVAMVEKANLISKESREVLNYIEELKKTLIDKTGGYDEDGNLKGAKEETEVEVMMIGADKSGKAYELKKKVNDYVHFVNSTMNKSYAPFALDASEQPELKNNPDQKNKDFAQLNFGQTPLVAALAVLSEIQNRVSGVETSLLTELYDKIGVDDYQFDRLTPMVRTGTKIVPAGMKYEADLFVTATSSTLKPEMYIDNNQIKVDEKGIGRISFTASGGNYNEDFLQKKIWKGKIKMKTPTGKDTIYEVMEEYFVAKPVIQVQNASMPSLYRNCGNKLNIQVPSLGNSYSPIFKAEGATVINGNRKGEIIVIPTGPRVSLQVNNNGFFIGEEKFKVELIPAPLLEIKVNGGKIDPLGISVMTLRNINVRANAETNFKNNLPDDAIYKVTEWKVSLAKGRRLKVWKDIKDTEFFNFSPWASNAEAGDNLIIEIKSVKRKNYKGEWEDVNIPDKPEIIPLI